MRAWIGIALLAASWLLGVNFYDLANLPAWIALVAAGTLLVTVHGDRHIYPHPFPHRKGQTLAALVLLTPAVWHCAMALRRRAAAAGGRAGRVAAARGLVMA